MLSELKTKLNKSIAGRILIKAYHYLIGIPRVKIRMVQYYLHNHDAYKQLHFYSDEEVFEMLASHGKSLARFGDGEMAWICGKARGYFGQENSERLSNMLIDVLTSSEEKVLIGIPNYYGEDGNEPKFNKEYLEARAAHLAEYENKWAELTSPEKRYADAFITRVYYGRPDRDAGWYFRKWKDVWNNRNVLIVEGAKTRFGVGNDLLDNAQSVKRIVAPAENAFSKYDEIVQSVKEHYEEGMLILTALGPTATILAYELGISSYQTIDIGHLDIEYEWYRSGAEKKTPVSGKYVNEAGGDSSTEMAAAYLKQYQSQILTVIE